MKSEERLTKAEINTRWRIHWNALVEANQIDAKTMSEQFRKMAATKAALNELWELSDLMPSDVKIYEDPPEMKPAVGIESMWPEDLFTTP